MEATGAYGEALALALHDAGHTVSVVNPARIAAYAKSHLARNKTDTLDAQLIARFCLKEEPPPWTPPAPEVHNLRALVRHLADLQTMRQAEVNRLQAGTHPVAVQQALEEHLAFLARQIEALRTQIDDHIEQHPELRRQRDLLISIKGIGRRTAARLLAEVGDIRSADERATSMEEALLTQCDPQNSLYPTAFLVCLSVLARYSAGRRVVDAILQRDGRVFTCGSGV